MFERIRRCLKHSARQSPLERGSSRRDQRRKQLRTEILESRLLLAGDAEFEPNGDRFTANQLALVEGVPGFLSGFAHGEITQGDSDFFTFEALAGDQILLAVDTSVDGLDPQVVLRNSAGAQLRQDSNSGPYGSSLTSVLTVETSGQFYAEVLGQSATSTGTYEIRADIGRGTQLEVDANFQNDQFASANALNYVTSGTIRNASVGATLMAAENTNRDEDLFRLGLLNAGMTLTLSTTTPTSSSVSPIVEVVNGQGDLVVDGDDTRGRFQGSIGADDVYYARVRTDLIRAGSRYDFDSLGTQTWTEAQANAETAGGNLVAITGAEEADAIDATIGRGTYWIGANDHAVNGNFAWTTGEPFSFERWDTNQPTSGNFAYSSNGRWFTRGDSRSYTGLFELPALAGDPAQSVAGHEAQYVLDVAISDLIPPTVTDVTSVLSSDTTTDQLVGSFDLTISEPFPSAIINHPKIVSFDGRTYLLTDTTQTLAESETIAAQYGGHVVDVNSEAEHEFLLRTFGYTSFWIGLDDIDTEGTYTWSSGATADPSLFYFADDEPNRPQDDGVFYSGGNWFDSSVTSNRRALIEITTPGTDGDADGLTDTLDPHPTDSLNGFDLREAGADGVFDTDDDQVMILGVRIDGRQLTFSVLNGPMLPGDYRFTMTPSLTDVVGNPLDGNGDGVGGDAFVHDFTVDVPGNFVFEGLNNNSFATAAELTFISESLGDDPLPATLLRTAAYGRGSFGSNQATTGSQNDIDYFKFSALEGDRVAINVDQLSGSTPQFELFDPEGNRVVFVGSSEGPSGTAFLSGRRLTLDGDYIIAVNRSTSSRFGDYQVRVDLARDVNMEFDANYSNNSTTSANGLGFVDDGNTRRASVAGAIMSAENGRQDNDRFSLGRLNAGTTISLDTRLPSWSTLSPVLDVFDASGNAVTDTDTATDVFRGEITVDGDYYARIRSEDVAIIDGLAFTLTDESLTWAEVSTAAETAGGTLASITSLDQQRLIYGTLGGSTRWLGINDSDTEGVFTYVDGTPLSDDAFTFWSGGTPDSASNSTSRDFVALQSWGGWVVESNSGRYQGVVQQDAPAGSPAVSGAGPLAQYVLDVAISDLIPPTVTDVTSVLSSDTTTDQLVGSFDLTISEPFPSAIINHPKIVSFDGRTYLLTDTTQTLAESETIAAQYGGHVVDVNSEAEHEFLLRTFGYTSFWIGLDDIDTEGTYTWSSGATADPSLFYFADDEPNRPQDDGVFYSGGNWFDSSVTSNRRALIEITTPGTDGDADGLTDTLDPHPTDSLNGFDLREAGADGVFDTDDDQVMILGVRIDGRQLTFSVLNGPMLPGDYRFTMTPSLTDVVGNPLDGNGDGVGGDAFVHDFTVDVPGNFVFEGLNNNSFATAAELTFISESLGDDPLPATLLRTAAYGRGSFGSNQATTGSQNDIDYFKFSALEGDRVAINVDQLSGSTPQFELFDPEGNRVVFVGSSEGPSGTAFLSGRRLTLDGDYIIAVNRSTSSRFGDYQVRVDLARDVNMEFDANYSNNSTTSANGLGFVDDGNTRRASVAGAIMSAENGRQDNDRFSLGRLNAGTTISLDTRLPSWSTLSPVLDVFDASGNAVTDTDTATDVFRGEITVDGDYYARIRSEDVAIIDGLAFTLTDESLTWAEVSTAAETAGGTLASITSLDQQRLIYGTLGGSTRWLGINDSDTEGVFTYVDGTPLSDDAFTFWSGGTPDSASNSTSRDFVALQSWGGWVVESNSGRYQGVVQQDAPAGSPAVSGAGPLAQYVLDVAISDLIPPTVTDVTSVLSSDTTTDQLVGSFDLTISEPFPSAIINHPKIVSFDGRTYLLTDTTQTLAESETIAAQYGGHVVDVNSEAEHEFLLRTFGYTSFWIGLDDIDTEGTYTWSSGATADPSLFYFADDEPNRPQDDGVFYSGGNWFDSSVTSNRRALIEITTPGTDGDADGLTDTLDPHPTDSLNGFDLREAGADGVFDTDDDQVMILGVRIDGRQLTFSVLNGPMLPGDYRFTMTPSLTDVVGNPLDGNGDGVGGDAFVHDFTVDVPGNFVFEGLNNNSFATAAELTFISESLGDDPLPATLLRTAAYGRGSFGSNQATTGSQNDIDYFKFSALEGDRVAINVDQLSGSTPQFELFDPEGNRVVFVGSSEGPSGTAFLSGRRLTLDGDYIIAVNRSTSSRFGDYQVRVDLARDVNMEFDANYSNNSTTSANGLGFVDDGNTRRASVAGAIMSAENGRQDNDRFSLGRLNAGTTISLDTRLPSWSTLSPVLDVFDASGNAVTDTDTATDVFRGEITVDGDYYARIRSEDVAIIDGLAFTLTDESLTWAEVSTAAETAGGTLASITSLDQQRLIYGTLGGSTRWLGINDSDTEGVFTYVDGTPLSDDAFTFWSGGTPDSASNSTSRDFVALQSWGGWVVESNSGRYQGVVQQDAPAGSPAVSGAGPLAQYVLDVAISDLIPPTITGVSLLPEEGGSTNELISTFTATLSESLDPTTVNHPWLASHNGRTYLLTQQTLTLAEARTLAGELGGHVVDINDESEQEFLTRTFAFDDYWIGLSDEITEGTHVWDSGEPLAFTNWAVNEPGNQDGVYLDGGSGSTIGQWRDSSPTSTRRAVIEILNVDTDTDGDGLTNANDPFSSDVLNGFDLREAGADGVFSTADDEARLLSVGLNGLELSFNVLDGPLVPGEYQLTFTPSLTDVVGNALDGNADGTAGDAFVRTFSVGLGGQFIDEGIGNRGFSTAAELTLVADSLGSGLFQTELYGRGSIDPSNDVDYFKFSAQTGDRVAINVDLLSGNLRPAISLYRADGTSLANDFNFSGPGVTAFISGAELDLDGEYFIEVGGRFNSNEHGDYQVRVDLARGIEMETDAGYSNDSISTANLLAPSVDGSTLTYTVTGEIMAGESGNVDDDFFSLGTIEAGNTILSRVRLPDGSTLRPALEIRDSANNVISLNPNPVDSNAIRADIGSDGVYYVDIVSLGGEGIGANYILDISVRPTSELDFADLSVRNVQIPDGPLTGGETVDVSWTVGNFGALATEGGSWVDRVVLSRNDQIGDFDDVTLGTVQRNGNLEIDEEYEASGTFTLPIVSSGQYQIFVVTDSGNSIAEFLFEDNNATGSEPVQIDLPPFADLTVTSVSHPTLTVVGEIEEFRWTVENVGTGPTTGGIGNSPVESWTDRIILSRDSILGNSDDVIVTDVPRSGVLASGDSYDGTWSGPLPAGLQGDYTVFVRSDTFSQVLEFGSVAPNFGQSDSVISIAPRPFADLFIESSTVDAVGDAGELVTINFEVSNAPDAWSATPTATWFDRVILSRDAVFGNNDEITLTDIRRAGVLGLGDSYQVTADVRLPFDASGDYSVFVQTDSLGGVYEFDREGNNRSDSMPIRVRTADLSLDAISTEDTANFGDSIEVTWSGRNAGEVAARRGYVDSVWLSTDDVLDKDQDRLLSGVDASNLLPIDLEQAFSQTSAIELPFDDSLPEGQYFLFVEVNSNLGQGESDYSNNVQSQSITLSYPALPDLTVTSVNAPGLLQPGQDFQLEYTAENSGSLSAEQSWIDRIYLNSTDSPASSVLLASIPRETALSAGESYSVDLNLVVPDVDPRAYEIIVRADDDDDVFERPGNDSNQLGTDLRISVVDLQPTLENVSASPVSGSDITIEWTTANLADVPSLTGWTDRVYLSADSILDEGDFLLGEVVVDEIIAGQAEQHQSVTGQVPTGIFGDLFVIISADAENSLFEGTLESNNTTSAPITITLGNVPNLVVSNVEAPERLIGDPAFTDISWTVTNEGNGPGSTTRWHDAVVLSEDETVGNSDDIIIGMFARETALDEGESYSRSETIFMPRNVEGRFNLFVVSDIDDLVFENGLKADNAESSNTPFDLMKIPFADLVATEVSAPANANSGTTIDVSWSVENQGIGTTDVATWSDTIWLTRDAEGLDRVRSLGTFSNREFLGVGESYERAASVRLDNGIEGTFYVAVDTNASRQVFEFINDQNNTLVSGPLEVSLAPSPDLVPTLTITPENADEGTQIDVSWTVENRGTGLAAGNWQDRLQLRSVNDGSIINLGTFEFEGDVPVGASYTRRELFQLPDRVTGAYELIVSTNVNAGLYEFAGSGNNTAMSPDPLTISIRPRADLQVSGITAPDTIDAGGTLSVDYTVINQGTVSTMTPRWSDRVYLSLDALLSTDDIIIDTIENQSALASEQTYQERSATIQIPERYRGTVYVIVQADVFDQVDEWPNDDNNTFARELFIDPLPLADLVVSEVVAPDQAIEGSEIEVRYTVTNSGIGTTNLDEWLETIWLTRDRNRPHPGQGDFKLTELIREGELGVDAGYDQVVRVTLPSDLESGTYYITPWTDPYGLVLEDTLAINVNPDDPNGIDNNNYKAREILVIGTRQGPDPSIPVVPPQVVVAPPADLDLVELTSDLAGRGGDPFTVSWTVTNVGPGSVDTEKQKWFDRVYLSDSPDPDDPDAWTWLVDSREATRPLGVGESYTTTITYDLTPPARGLYVIVQTVRALQYLTQKIRRRSNARPILKLSQKTPPT